MKKIEPHLLEALKEYDRKEIELLEKQAEEADLELSAEFNEKMNQLFDTHTRRHKFTKFFNTTARKIASFGIIFLIVALVTIASVDAFRKPIISYLTQDRITDTSVEVITDEKTDIPTNIEEYKEPSYIPKGYEIVSVNKDILGQEIVYEKPNTKYMIMYSQSVISGTISYFNTEEGTLRDITVGIYDGKWLSMPQENTECIYWSDGKYGYDITAFYIDVKELIKIAESIR